MVQLAKDDPWTPVAITEEEVPLAVEDVVDRRGIVAAIAGALRRVAPATGTVYSPSPSASSIGRLLVGSSDLALITGKNADSSGARRFIFSRRFRRSSPQAANICSTRTIKAATPIAIEARKTLG